MTLQDDQSLTIPQRPLTGDHEEWQAYSERWAVYYNQYKDQYKHPEDLKGWQEYHNNWREYWQKQRKQPWRTEPLIESERRYQLDEWRRNIELDIQKGKKTFGGQKLARADIEYLLATHENGQGPISWSDQTRHLRTGLDLRGADLRGVDLSDLPLTMLIGGLSGNEWREATIEQREAAAIHLEKATMRSTHLEGANLRSAHLRGAYLRYARLEWAYLRYAHFEEASLRYAHLEKADMGGAFFDDASQLEHAQLADPYGNGPLLEGVHWGGVDLSDIDWKVLKKIDDEVKAHESTSRYTGTVKTKATQIKHYRNAANAYRQLFVTLQSQGLNEEAARFSYRSQLMQRTAFWREKKGLTWLFSWILDLVAGYGYKPQRFFFATLAIVVFFGCIYFVLGLRNPTHLTIMSAFVSSFQSLLAPDFKDLFASVQGSVAAIEGLFGIFIAAILIAVVTNRILNK